MARKSVMPPWKEDPPRAFFVDDQGRPEHEARVELTPAQLRALADLAEGLGANRRLTIRQTWTPTGGFHVYVWDPVKRTELHVAARGSTFDLGDDGRGAGYA